MVNHLKNPVERSEAIDDIATAEGDLHYIVMQSLQIGEEPFQARFEANLEEVRSSASRWKDALGFQLSVIKENPYNEGKVREACTALNEMSADMLDLAKSLPGPLGKIKEELRELAIRLSSTCSLK